MKYIGFIALFFTGMITVYAQNGTKNFINQNYIEVTGSAEMEVIPNRIYLQISISEKDKNSDESLEVREQKMYNALKKIGIDVENKLSIISFSSTYIRYFFKRTTVLKAKQYELLLTDALQLAPVYATLDSLDITQVNIVKLDHSDIEKFKEETQIKAVIAAQNKAKLYTQAIRQTAGKALFIQELNTKVSLNAVLDIQGVVSGASTYTSKVDRYVPSIQLKKIVIHTKVLTRFALN